MMISRKDQTSILWMEEGENQFNPSLPAKERTYFFEETVEKLKG